ncbi:hypothetical protein ACFL1X_14550 [Candidatus Hydrogenedentota bacterium]
MKHVKEMTKVGPVLAEGADGIFDLAGKGEAFKGGMKEIGDHATEKLSFGD